jgi:cytoskeleton protein RodZ
MVLCLGGGNLTIRPSAGIVGPVTEDNERPLGEWLRQRREDLGISLEQVEEDTRIRVRYLQALETEDFGALPDPVVGRGFLRNYAVYLELDPQEAAARFSRALPGFAPEPVSVREPSTGSPEAFHPVPLHEMPGFRTRRGLLFGGVVILIAAIGVAAWWSYPYFRSIWFQAPAAVIETAAPSATLQAVVEDPATDTPLPAGPTVTTVLPSATVAEATPTLELTLTPTFTPSPSPSPSPPVYTGVFLELVVSSTSWIQVTVDNVRQFQGELEAGTYKSWYGEDQIVLRIGNAGAVQVTVNGQNLGALGAPGEVVDRIFEKVGDQVTEMTATPGVSGTVTSPVTETVTTEPATPSATAESTAAISPTETITPTAGP